MKNWLIWKDPDAGQDWRGGGEGDDRGWHGWMVSPTQWTWVWAGSRSCWWTGKPGMLPSMGSQRGRHDWVTALKDTDDSVWCTFLRCFVETIIATRWKNLTAWWSDCSHDISCCIFFCFSSLVDLQHLQYSDNLCYMAKWLSYTHIYIYSFLCIFPLWFITGYWI